MLVGVAKSYLIAFFMMKNFVFENEPLFTLPVESLSDSVPSTIYTFSFFSNNTFGSCSVVLFESSNKASYIHRVSELTLEGNVVEGEEANMIEMTPSPRRSQYDAIRLDTECHSYCVPKLLKLPRTDRTSMPVRYVGSFECKYTEARMAVFHTHEFVLLNAIPYLLIMFTTGVSMQIPSERRMVAPRKRKKVRRGAGTHAALSPTPVRTRQNRMTAAAGCVKHDLLTDDQFDSILNDENQWKAWLKTNVYDM